MTELFRAAADYFNAAQDMTTKIHDTQGEALEQAAALCIDSIDKDGLVHLFGTGHSRMAVEEMFPRHGSFPGFHPIIELSMTNHTQVVGGNGQRQAMFIERVEGFAEVILNNYIFGADDVFMIFSNSGVNAVVVETAMGARKRGMPVIAVVSRAHSTASEAKHSSGQKLIDLADIVIDNCTPVGDALIHVENLEYPVGPGSTIAYGLIVNMLKCMIADGLTQRGKAPLVLTSSAVIGAEASKAVFEASYDDYRARIARLYGGGS